MWNERREKLLKTISNKRNELQLELYAYRAVSGQGEGYGGECGHFGGNYWRRNRITEEVVAVVPSLRRDSSDELEKLMRLEYHLLVKKTSGPEWEQYDPYK